MLCYILNSTRALCLLCIESRARTCIVIWAGKGSISLDLNVNPFSQYISLTNLRDLSVSKDWVIAGWVPNLKMPFISTEDKRRPSHNQFLLKSDCLKKSGELGSFQGKRHKKKMNTCDEFSGRTRKSFFDFLWRKMCF